MQESQTGTYQQVVHDTDNSIIAKRLETDNLLSEIKDFLRGEKTFIRELNGKIVSERISYGKPQCNDEGCQQIMGLVTCTVNPHTVQGNLDKKDYEIMIWGFHRGLAFIVVDNWNVYGIPEHNRHMLMLQIMQLVVPFLSRTVGDGERKSYAKTMHTTESNATRSKDGLFSFTK